MQKVLFTALLTLVFFSNSRSQTSPLPYDSSMGLITYEEIIDLTGFTKADLFVQAEAWVHDFYKNPTNVIQESDAEKGKIVGKHTFYVYNIDKKGVKTKSELIRYTFKIWVKNDKYRYKISDFSVAKTSKYPLERWLTKANLEDKRIFSYLEQINNKMEELLESLHEGLKKAEQNDDEDDW